MFSEPLGQYFPLTVPVLLFTCCYPYSLAPAHPNSLAAVGSYGQWVPPARDSAFFPHFHYILVVAFELCKGHNNVHMHTSNWPCSPFPDQCMLQSTLMVSSDNQLGVWACPGGNYIVTVGRVLWGEPAAAQQAMSRRGLETLVASLPSQVPQGELSLLPVLFVLFFPGLFSPQFFTARDNVGHQLWTPLINLHACEPVSTSRVQTI